MGGIVGFAVECKECGKTKAPRGRSAPAELYLCDMHCPGWDKYPLPGDLWPGETADDFGYPCEGPTLEGEGGE